MATSISTANKDRFGSDQNVPYRISDEIYGDTAVIIVKKEALSDDENIQSSDRVDEFYEFVDTSLPVDVVCSELQNASKTPENGSILLNLLTDSALKNYQQTCRNGVTTLKTYSKSSLKLNLVGNEVEFRKCRKQSRLKRSVKLVSQTVVQRGAEKSEIETQECQPGQEMIIVKEEVLSDDEGASNEEYYNTESTSLPVNIQCLQVENGNSVSLAGNASGRGSNVEVLADSSLKNYHIYDDVESALELDSKPVNLNLHLVNKKKKTRKHREHFRFMKSYNVKVKKETRPRSLKTNPVITPSYVAPVVEHEFKCQECNETFELKSHLVMHEISHEQYRRYKAYASPDYVKQSQSEQQVYKCKECNANFELKSSFYLHKLWHEKQRTKVCRCKSAPSASVSDLCTCIVRVCNLCNKSFFASVRLKNWTSCIRCLLQMDTKKKIKQTSAERTQASKRYRNKVSNRKFDSTLTDVKRLCYFCGKMCANVVKFGLSWICYDCWNAKLKQKCATDDMELNNESLQEESDYPGLNCTYCLRLFPLKSCYPDHKCFHKSVYLWNQCSWFNDCNEREGDVDLNETGNEEDVEMVIDTTELSDVDDGSSSSEVMLCDKTGELINLRCEADASASGKTRKSHAGGESI